MIPCSFPWSSTIPQAVTPVAFDQILPAGAFTGWYRSPKMVRVAVRVRPQKNQCLWALVRWYGYLPRYATPPAAHPAAGAGARTFLCRASSGSRRQFTPALAAASGSICLRALVAAERIFSSRLSTSPTRVGTAGFACAPNMRSESMASR